VVAAPVTFLSLISDKDSYVAVLLRYVRRVRSSGGVVAPVPLLVIC
jgi:hypothetical protein